MTKENSLIIIAVLLSCLSFVFSLFAFAPMDYNELEGLPDLSGFGSYGNLTGVPVVDLAHGLCLWLPFDGVGLDKSGYGNNGVVTGAVYVDGVFGQSLSFDGVDDFVNVPDSPLLEGFGALTVSFWMSISSSVGSGSAFTVVSKEYWENYMILVTDGQKLRFQLHCSGGSALLDSVTTFYPNVMYFVVCSYDGAVMELFVNNVFDNSVSQSGNVVSSTYDFKVGKIDLYDTWYYNGTIDDVRVYNRVLSGYEISALYGLGV